MEIETVPHDGKYMDLGEFRRLGYLQEVNRRVLHPLGLALELNCCATCDECGVARPDYWAWRVDPQGAEAPRCPKCQTAAAPHFEYSFGGIWDCREEPAGIFFETDSRKELAYRAARVFAQWRRRRPTRERALGYMIQPLTARATLGPGRLRAAAVRLCERLLT